MAYGAKTNEHELVQLQDEITNEVHRDAEHLATSVFGKKNTMPGLERVDNTLLDARYRAAYEQPDREWLTAEARRDPLQFLEVSRRIGAYVPSQVPQLQVTANPAATQPPVGPPTPPPAPVPPALSDAAAGGFTPPPGPQGMALPPAAEPVPQNVPPGQTVPVPPPGTL